MEDRGTLGVFIFLIIFFTIAMLISQRLNPVPQIEKCVQGNIQTRNSAIEKFKPTQEELTFAEWFAKRYTAGDKVPDIMQGNFAGVDKKGMAMFMLREYKTFKK